MKVLFLDVDGVLNNKRHITELQRMKKKGIITSEEYFKIWDLPYHDTMYSLQRIVNITKCKIVLISTWRLFKDKVRQLNKVFNNYGLKISDKVANYVDLFYVKIPKEKIYSLNKVQERTTDKGALITKWLDEHKNVKKFVIVSDELCDIKEYFNKDVIVRTVFEQGGLNDKIAEDIICKFM